MSHWWGTGASDAPWDARSLAGCLQSALNQQKRPMGREGLHRARQFTKEECRVSASASTHRCHLHSYTGRLLKAVIKDLGGRL